MVTPYDWSSSIITPIHKKGSKLDPNNYCGISLIDSICKIFVNIMNSRLTQWCDDFDILHECQAGFGKKYSTMDNIFVLMSLVQKYLCKRKGRFYCIFIDFSEAFDSIRHDKLWDAMQQKGITGKFMEIYKSMYSKLRSCVKVNGGITDYFNCTIGTRQGCITSPKFFSLFINDLVSYLNNDSGRGIFVSNGINCLNMLMYADDVSSFWRHNYSATTTNK